MIAKIKKAVCLSAIVLFLFSFSPLFSKGLSSHLKAYAQELLVQELIPGFDPETEANLNRSLFGANVNDNITVTNLTSETFSLSNDAVTLNVSSYGQITSLIYNLEEQLRQPGSISSLTYPSTNKLPRDSILFSPLGNNLYKIGYSESEIKVILEIVPKKSYFEFTVKEILNPQNEPIDTLFFLKFELNPPQLDYPYHAGNLIVQTLPLNGISSCICYANYYYVCNAEVASGLIGAKGALVTATQSSLAPTIKQLIQDNNLPYVTFDNKWFRESDNLREGYIFAKITPENYESILEYAKRGKFKQILILDPLVNGYYSQPKDFPNQAEFFRVLQTFIDNNIKIGIHTFLFRTIKGDPLFSPANLYKEEIGHISQTIAAQQTSIILDNNFAEDKAFIYSTKAGTWSPKNRQKFLIDNEIISCEYESNILKSCSRGSYDTAKASHNSGASVYIFPDAGIGFYLKPNSEALEISTQSFSNFIRQFNVSFVYIDGPPFFPKYGIKDVEIGRNYVHGNAVLPYILKMDQPPFFQFAEYRGSLAYFYSNRKASGDGVIFKSKDYTKSSKVPLLNKSSTYYTKYELGWWKFHGAQLSNGNLDFDAVTFDDTHYIMTRALAFDSSVGLQLSSFYENHRRLDELFDIVGLYHSLIKEDTRDNIIPQEVKKYLQDPEHEAELNRVSGYYNMVEKKVDKRYAVWYNIQAFDYDVANPFGDQPLNIEIRPKFDYYPFDDPRHVMIANFAEQPDVKISTSSEQLSCNMDSAGRITLDYSSSVQTIGTCTIELPGTFDLRYKRGVGVHVTGDGKNEVVVVSLSNNGYGVREYKFNVDFTDSRKIMLGDPTTETRYCIDALCKPPPASAMKRSWDYDFTNNNIKVIIYVKPGSYSLQLHSLIGLQEKGSSSIVNPVIQINGDIISFPVTLSANATSPHILQYNGFTKEYKLYTSNYGYLSNGHISDNIVVRRGQNHVRFSSDISNSEYAARADVRISIYDDEDGDMIPTNGSYSTDYIPCNGNSNFCDDNCPSVYNPDQRDSDADGIGESCENIFSPTPTSSPILTPIPCLRGNLGNLDCESDGCIDTGDFELFRPVFGKSVSTLDIPPAHHTPDLVIDSANLIDTADYVIFRNNFGRCN